MESKSLLFKENTWSIFRLGEKAWLLKPEISTSKLEAINEFSRTVEGIGLDEIVNVIPAYDSITIITRSVVTEITSLLSEVLQVAEVEEISTPKEHKIKVCYSLGLDWDEMEKSTELDKNEIIKIHSSKEYKVAMTGFLPGFIFLAGLSEEITVSRKENPRISVPAGSIGIGGNQTGIYSLESPGGWQIIGRTPQSFFNVDENPPMNIKAGDKVKFISISEDEFNEMEANNG